MWESVEKLILDYLIPNTCEKMEWQEFRDNKLWCLEIDDLFKANLGTLQTVYKRFATLGNTTKKILQKDDVVTMIEEADI